MGGFSLVEVLVALAVMSLMAGVVVLALPKGDARLRDEVRQLAVGIEMAAQESVVTGRAMGLAISNEGYRYWRMRDGAWESLEGDHVFGAHVWADATFVEFERSGYFTSPESAQSAADYSYAGPLVHFDPTGIPTQFTIRIERGATRYELLSDGWTIEVSNASL